MKGRYGEEIFAGVEGRTLVGLAVSNDGETTLRLRFAEGPDHFVTTEGDCCSESWWADAIGAKSCYGALVTGVRELELTVPDDDNRTRQESDEVYGYAIDTIWGTITLAFRNSSNGYYGGWASDVPDVPNCPDRWTEITDNDWRA